MIGRLFPRSLMGPLYALSEKLWYTHGMPNRDKREISYLKRWKKEGSLRKKLYRRLGIEVTRPYDRESFDPPYHWSLKSIITESLHNPSSLRVFVVIEIFTASLLFVSIMAFRLFFGPNKSDVRRLCRCPFESVIALRHGGKRSRLHCLKNPSLSEFRRQNDDPSGFGII